MKKFLIAFLVAAVLLAAEDILARKCRGALWCGMFPALVLAGTAAAFASGALPPLPCLVLPAAALNAALLGAWAVLRIKTVRRQTGLSLRKQPPERIEPQRSNRMEEIL